MAIDDPESHGFSLKRWSRRKLEAAREASVPAPDSGAAARGTAVPPAPPLPSAAPATPGDVAAAPALPPIDSLTIDSDFSVFLGANVDPAVKLQALKTLFRDPRFNVMDGLDVYIDDYSLPDPLAPEIARSLAHARYIFDPPRTRVNESGIVEDAPPDEASSGARAPAPDGALPDVTIASAAAVPAGTASSPPLPGAASNCEADFATGVAKPSEGSEPARR